MTVAKKLDAGTAITCPGCDKIIAVVNRDIHPGDVLGPTLFRWSPGFAIRRGDKMRCLACSTPFSEVITQTYTIKTTRIHTEKGWFSG